MALRILGSIILYVSFILSEIPTLNIHKNEASFTEDKKTLK